MAGTYYLPILKKCCRLGVVVNSQPYPPGLESGGETMLHGISRLDLEVGVMEPLSVTGRVDLDSECHVTGRAVEYGHFALVIETDQEGV